MSNSLPQHYPDATLDNSPPTNQNRGILQTCVLAERKKMAYAAGEVPGQIRRGLRMFAERSRGAPGVLRLPGGALETSAGDESDRIDLCDDSATSPPHERQRHQEDELGDDVQAGPSRSNRFYR